MDEHRAHVAQVVHRDLVEPVPLVRALVVHDLVGSVAQRIATRLRELRGDEPPRAGVGVELPAADDRDFDAQAVVVGGVDELREDLVVVGPRPRVPMQRPPQSHSARMRR